MNKIVMEIIDNNDSVQTLTSSIACSTNGHEFNHAIPVVREGDKYFQANHKRPIYGQTHIARRNLDEIIEVNMSLLKFPLPTQLTRRPGNLLLNAYTKKPKLINLI